jgi:Protein of unknown function (DUF3435)
MSDHTLKGTSGADDLYLFRTKFFLHRDYKLAYCPIIQIVSLAFRDNAFENDRLTPEIFWKMRVTRKESITLKWKSEVLDQPVLRRMTQDETSNKVDKNLPMTYSVGSAANTALCQDAGFPDMTFYADRRWVGNEANSTCLAFCPIIIHPTYCLFAQKTLLKPNERESSAKEARPCLRNIIWTTM